MKKILVLTLQQKKSYCSFRIINKKMLKAITTEVKFKHTSKSENNLT
jgi:hypothetical protein